MHKIKSFHIPKIMLPFRKKVCYNTKVRRGVAQFGSALDWGSRGRKFKSCRSDHFLYSFAGGHAAFAKHPRGISSAGRAPGSQSGGQGFDPPMLHQVRKRTPFGVLFLTFMLDLPMFCYTILHFRPIALQKRASYTK